nr:methylamine dehydrogenase [Actinomycetota bacterium]
MEGWWAASYLVLWLLVVMLCVVVVALARQIGTLHLRLG